MSAIPLNPLGKKEIEELEKYLFFYTLFRKEVLDLIKDPEERLRWVDSLFIAAMALARSKARMSLKEIAEELGRTEATIRKHINGESKAGRLVNEIYSLIKEEKLKSEIGLVNLFLSGDLSRIIEENKKYKEILNKIKELVI